LSLVSVQFVLFKRSESKSRKVIKEINKEKKRKEEKRREKKRKEKEKKKKRREKKRKEKKELTDE